MIKYVWRDELSVDEATELKDLLDDAATFDAEAEHNAIAFSDIADAMAHPDGSVRHLVIWMLPHAGGTDVGGEPERMAGIVRLVLTSPETAELTVVIAPRFRAIGILTLLLEQVGVDTDGPDGWLDSGANRITAWARGNHPATGRISNRFLIPHTRRVWKLIRPLNIGDGAPTERPVLHSESGSVTVELDPTKSTMSDEFGRCATIDMVTVAPTADPGVVRDLLDSAASVAAQNGYAAVAIHIDSDDAVLVNACRRSGFQHDRTDVRYELGGTR